MENQGKLDSVCFFLDVGEGGGGRRKQAAPPSRPMIVAHRSSRPADHALNIKRYS